MPTSIHHHTLRSRFSAAARTYAHASPLQGAVAQQVLDLVPHPFEPATVLDVGCGSGRLLRAARERWPKAKLTGIDIAPGMIDEARAAFEGDRLTSFLVGDVSLYRSATPYDAVVSSSALHWLRPFAEGLAHTASLCRAGGLVAIAIMLDGTLGELHEARKQVAPHKTPAGRMPTWRELKDAARVIPDTLICRAERVLSEYVEPSAMDLLRNIHAMGVTGGDVSRGAAPLTRRELQDLAQWYDRHHATRDGVRVTFVAGYLLLERRTRQSS